MRGGDTQQNANQAVGKINTLDPFCYINKHVFVLVICPWSMSTRWGVTSFRGHLLHRRRWRRLKGIEGTHSCQRPQCRRAGEGAHRSRVIASASFRPGVALPLPRKLHSFSSVLPACLTCARHGRRCRKQGLKDISPLAYFPTTSLKGDFFFYRKAFCFTWIDYYVNPTCSSWKYLLIFPSLWNQP